MLHPPGKEKIFEGTIFRNDDVSFDTNLDNFKKINALFHKYGFVQLHGIMLYGKANDTLVVNGIPWKYTEIGPGDMYDYEKCVSVSRDFIGDNRELVDYINSIPDPIALHGLYHSDYSNMTCEQQEQDIKEGLRLLKILFPEKKVDTFIAPFNRTNEYTYSVCEKYALRISALEGEHLEDRLHNGKGPVYDGELYRYHHHRFYPESTFCYYDLSLEKLEEYLKKFSYTYNERSQRSVPAYSLYKACCEFFHMSLEQNCRLSEIEKLAENLIKRYTGPEDKLLQINSGRGKLLLELWSQGYSNIYAIEEKKEEKELSDKISRLLCTNIEIYSDREAYLGAHDTIKTIIYYPNGGTGYPAYEVFSFGTKVLDETGYFIFINPSDEESALIDIASNFNAMLMEEKPYSQIENDIRVYVFKRIKPRICLLCDRPNWAFDYSAREIKKFLSDEFRIDIKYVIDEEDLSVNDYDVFQVFFWGEECYKKNNYSKSRILKQVCSHRWQFDHPYGPITVKEFVKRYLNDVSTVMCPSRILYELLQKEVTNLFLCGEGYSPELFKYNKARTGEISFCMVGNLKDPVKGVNDILRPATDGYRLDLAQKLKHEELPDFYNDHDVYVVSSVHEANPLPLIEAMACGCFPIASKIGIAPELIRHKENGYLVEHRSADEFRRAVKWCEENLTYIRGKAADIANETYGNRRWELMAENYRLMYRNHIGRK